MANRNAILFSSNGCCCEWMLFLSLAQKNIVKNNMSLLHWACVDGDKEKGTILQMLIVAVAQCVEKYAANVNEQDV